MENLRKPAVGLIGAAGAMGSRLLRRLLDAGYTVHAYDSHPLTLNVLRLGTVNLEVHQSALSVCLKSEVIILAVPYHAEQSIAADVGDSVGNRIVVSITNPLTPTLDDVITPPDESAAEHLCQLMPHARVVKALNTLSASALDIPRQPRPLFDTFVASNDRDAAHLVESMITDIGFRPWYVGALILSRTLERMSALLIGVSQRYALQGALGWRVEQVQPSPDTDA
jgi:predicted dinucleotide-binding enzyme